MTIFIKFSGFLVVSFKNIYCKPRLVGCNLVTRNNIVWKLAHGYCLCYCKTFSLVPDSTECTKKFFTEECSTLFAPPKIRQYHRSKENHQYKKTLLSMIDFV